RKPKSYAASISVKSTESRYRSIATSTERLGSHEIVDIEQRLQEFGHLIQIVLSRRVAPRLGRVRVRLDEDAFHAGRHAGARQRREELPRAAARVLAGDAVLADRVGDVEHHRIADLPHQVEASRVDHEVVVAEGVTALGED